MNQIAVYMSEDEAKQFISFQKNRKFFEVLDKQRAFDILNSSFEVHINSQGQVSVVEFHRTIRL